MLGNEFYDKQCTISSISIVDDGVSEVEQKVALYENIDCSFWRSGAGEDLKDTTLGRRTDQSSYQVSLRPEYSQVREGMEIELFEKYGGVFESIGSYKINFVEAYDKINGQPDHIYISCTRDGE